MAKFVISYINLYVKPPIPTSLHFFCSLQIVGLIDEFPQNVIPLLIVE